MRVGFIGLGSQGGPMARRIVEGGFDLTLWARREASTDPYADTAAKVAATPAELGAASDLVCLCVVGDDDVRQVLHGESGVLAGLQAGTLVGGAVLTETVFAWPGIGRLMYEALLQRDYNLLLGVFVVCSAMVLIFNLVTDLVYRLVDPRIEFAS